MTTTLASIAGSVGPRGGVPVEGHSAGWAASARADIGTLPGCRLRRVSEYIQQNLDKGLSLAELAGVVYMSPYHFARLFKRSRKPQPAPRRQPCGGERSARDGDKEPSS